MKNRRDVCYAKDAGFIQFDGLPGSIKTGCPETPEFKNRYCSHHKSQACDLQSCEEVDDELDAQSGPTMRMHQKKQSAGNPIAEMILAKKTTRKQTYYQVTIKDLCHVINNIFIHQTFSKHSPRIINTITNLVYTQFRSCGLGALNAMPRGNLCPLSHKI